MHIDCFEVLGSELGSKALFCGSQYALVTVVGDGQPLRMAGLWPLRFFPILAYMRL